MVLKRIIWCFQLVLGLKVDIFKSLLVGIGYSKETTRVLANIIWCKSKRLPIIYLSLPIGVNSRSKSLWDPVVEETVFVFG